MSRTPWAPRKWLSCSSQIHFAPSASTVTLDVSRIPSRRAHCFQRRPKRSLRSIAANATRDSGAGSVRSLHCWGVAASPRFRFEKMPSFISRQPPVVLTLAPSVLNSISPSASRNSRHACGSVVCHAFIAAPCCCAISRMVFSLMRMPHNSSSRRDETSYDQLAAANDASR